MTLVDDAIEARPPIVAATRRNRPVLQSAVIWLFRLLILVPVVFMTPEIYHSIRGSSKAIRDAATSGNDVLGTGGLMLFFMMLAVTPIATVTGQRWFLVLRRDFGRGMFAVALLDLILAATTTANRIPGGLLTRVAGHGFLLFGTLSVFLVLPIVFTSNRKSQRWLGQNWKWVHRFVYAVWVTILIHLAFLFAFRQFFVDALIVSAPLVIMRLHPVRRRFVAWRTGRRHQRSRWICGLLLLGIFAYGLYPSFPEIISTGAGAFTLHPVA